MGFMEDINGNDLLTFSSIRGGFKGEGGVMSLCVQPRGAVISRGFKGVTKLPRCMGGSRVPTGGPWGG